MNERKLRTSLAIGIAASLLATTVPTAHGQIGGASADQQKALQRHRAELADFADARSRDRVAQRYAVTAAKSVNLKDGDLLSATTRRSAALLLRPNGTKARIRKLPLREEFVPRGVAVDGRSGRVAIAAVSRVVLYDSGTGDVEVLTGPDGEPFAFVNAVLFDRAGLLIVADQGETVGRQLPADGRIWEYDGATGDYRQIGTRRDLSNPKHLALDDRGRVYVVDGSSGPRVTPLLDVHYDTVWRLSGVTRKQVRPIYREAGLQATAFAIDADRTFWFGSAEEILLLDGKTLEHPCPLPSPLSFVTGIAFGADGEALAIDGSDLDGPRRIVYEVDAACVVTQRGAGPRLKGARGLSVYGPPGD